MAMGIFQQLSWLTNKFKRLCCAIDNLNKANAQEAINNPSYFEVVWNDINSAWSTLSDANTDMSSSFTSMITLGNTQRFYGGSNFTLTLGNNINVTYADILSINDIGGIVTDAGGANFSICTGLQYVNLPKSLLSGTKNFRFCAALRYANLPSVTDIGTECFNGCTSLETLNINKCNTMSTIGDVFQGISGLTITVTLPAALVTDPNIVTLQTNNTVTLIIV
jgi:hypothetical protein